MALKESGSQGSHHSEEIVSRSERFIEKYSKTIIWCVLGVIVLGVGIWLYIDKVVKPRGDKAAAELYLAEEQLWQVLIALRSMLPRLEPWDS